MDTNKNIIHAHTKHNSFQTIRTTQKTPTEKSDGTNSEMILTNEVTIPIKHTESSDINEDYMKLFYELTVSTEPSSSSSSSILSSSAWSPSSDYGGAYTIETDTTYPSSDSNSPKMVNVIAV